MVLQLLFPHPLLSTTAAHAISLAFGSIYVGSLYLSKKGRLSFRTKPALTRSEGHGRSLRAEVPTERGRDDPVVIRARLEAVSIATALSCLGVFGVIWWYVEGTWKKWDMVLEATLLRLGFLPPDLSRALFTSPSEIFNIRLYSAHFITPVLFLGSLFGTFLGGRLPGQRNWKWENHVVARFFTIQGVRNYWVAPITEEIVFRACVLAIYHLSGASTKRMIFLAPLTFGLAHVHHAWETYNRYGRTPAAAKHAIFMTIFQLTYTTLFGINASYLFLRTGSLWPSISSHIFCNIMGTPEISFEIASYRKWKWVIITMYLAGIAGFVYALPRWSYTEGNLYWPVGRDNTFLYGKY